MLYDRFRSSVPVHQSVCKVLIRPIIEFFLIFRFKLALLSGKGVRNPYFEKKKYLHQKWCQNEVLDHFLVQYVRVFDDFACHGRDL